MISMVIPLPLGRFDGPPWGIADLMLPSVRERLFDADRHSKCGPDKRCARREVLVRTYSDEEDLVDVR